MKGPPAAACPYETTTVGSHQRPNRIRVLSIHGGGMRGAYAAAFLNGLAEQAARRQGLVEADVGRTFDLIVGTSTGGILACALAAGVPLGEVLQLYLRHGREIFPVKLPGRVDFELVRQMFTRSKHLARGTEALRTALRRSFGDRTVRDVYGARGIALAIPAVDMSNHRGWVFKTSHLGGHRDDGYTLVDVCLATSAAPIYRSMAWVADALQAGTHQVFVDGGLWANNPILVGLVDALRMSGSGDRIELFSLGTCSRPPGDHFEEADMHRGFSDWRFGGGPMGVSVDAQGYVYDNIADMLADHLDRDCHVIRFPQAGPPANAMGLLDLDDASDEAMDFLISQASADVSLTLSACDKRDSQGRLLSQLLKDMLPPLSDSKETE